jgi:hypothetical protein
VSDSGSPVTFERDGDRVRVLADGDPFTAYCYDGAAEVLTKPVLYPLRTAAGKTVTRGFPIDPREGERTDHPHHVGAWLAYGNVDGIDFWNNSPAVDDADGYGRIRHRSLDTVDDATGTLAVSADWTGPDGDVLLEETTTFRFRADDAAGRRAVDRETTLSAPDGAALTDDKEGLYGLRVCRELEHPADEPVTLTDRHGGEVTVEPGGDDATGEYLTSGGVRGTDAWGTRAAWVRLAGTVGDSDVAVTLMDHPDNVAHPTGWHARGYGLFAANPLARSVFTDGEERLEFALAAGESTTLRYRLALDDGVPASDDLDERHAAFADGDWTR